MTILVFGKSGQLARALADASANRTLPISFVGRDEADFLVEGAASAIVRSVRPSLVVNAVAYTDVDGAEKESAKAFRVNAEAVGEIAEEATECGAGLIHLSTDYVFDGKATVPYREDSPVAPINCYGQSKLEGERAIARFCPDHLIVRTSWLVSPYGRNFVKTMLGLAESRSEIAVVDDQIGRPTSASALAEALLEIVSRWNEVPKGLMHFSGGGEPCSWADVAQQVFDTRRDLFGTTTTVRRIGSRDYPTPAARPRYSVLDCCLAEESFGLDLPDWRSGVRSIARQVMEARA